MPMYPLKAAAVMAALCLTASAQAPAPQEAAKDAVAAQPHGLPPRAAPTEYLSHTQAGALTIAAEFKGHNVPTAQNPLTTEDYVVVEVGLFGGADGKLKISAEDFTLRVNGKKQALASQPFGMVIGNVKDPEWEPPASEKKSKGSGLSTGGGGQQDNTPPPPPKVPIEVQRAMAKSVQHAALPEGDRTLPQAGLLFFQYHGKASGIHSVELIYGGPAGKVTMPLQP